MNKRNFAIIVFALLCLFLKIYFIAAANPHLRLGYDDQRNYTIAANHVQGNGYCIYDYMVKHYRLSAFHSSSTIFLYEFFIKHHVPQKSIVIVYYILSTILYLLAVFYVYHILQVLAVPQTIACIATAIFALYPSVMYAVGSIYHFDNIVMPLHVINFYYLLQWIKRKSTSPGVKIFLLLSITFCCFLRSQVLVLYFMAGCLLLFVYVKNLVKTKQADRHMLFFVAVLAVSIILVYIPTLIKNKGMFNAYIISTQSGFEFLQGHNAFQKGNWMPPERNNPLNVYVYSREPHIDSMDEYTESKVRSRLAWEWIEAHPGKEAGYMVKKAARYFMPENAQVNLFKPVFHYHPLNMIVHLVFLASLLMLAFRNRKVLLSEEVLLLSIPVMATLVLSMLYYFDFRLRYHAEPFTIALAAYFVVKIFASKKQQQTAAFSKAELAA